MNSSQLFKKYDVPAPRYTSYPTVPYWSDSPSRERWLTSLSSAMKKPDTRFALYLHLPFCETLCTFCGCNTVITRNHQVENPYVERILKEWELYLAAVPEIRERELLQLHLGGGTPTFLGDESLKTLLSGILSRAHRSGARFDGSVEVDPRRTTLSQLEIFRSFGFKRVSLGVQDFEPEVQRLVNRIQPFEITQSITLESRKLGFTSVNFDLIYGLPKQTAESFERTARTTIGLKPDRIALYSFALVPWIKKIQRIFKDEDLPTGEAKRELYEIARRMLLEAGYVEIGMDHFALPTDELAISAREGTLHRNFMGYTELRTDVLLGLGLSSISETPDCFHQNEKVLPVYEREIDQGNIPTFRGHLLSVSDQAHREQILNLMTRFEVEFSSPEQREEVRAFLREILDDGCALIQDNRIVVTDRGRPFLRNICMAFDERLRAKQPEARVFSQSV